MALKHKVKSLIDESWFKFQEDNPNVRTNSLEIHGSSLISVLEDEDTWELKNFTVPVWRILGSFSR